MTKIREEQLVVQNGAVLFTVSPPVLRTCFTLNDRDFNRFICLLRTVRNYGIYFNFLPHIFLINQRLVYKCGAMHSLIITRGPRGPPTVLT